MMFVASKEKYHIKYLKQYVPIQTTFISRVIGPTGQHNCKVPMTVVLSVLINNGIYLE